MRHLLDRIRFWAVNEPTRLAHRLAAFVAAATGGGLVVADEHLAAAVAAGAAVVQLVVAYYVRDRVVPTNARLPAKVIERLESVWRQGQR